MSDNYDYESFPDNDDDEVEEEDDEDEFDEIEDFNELNEENRFEETSKKILESLNNSLQEGIIDDYTYALEHLLILYHQLIKYKRFNITDETDNIKIDTLKKLRLELQSDELDYDRKYYNLLKTEYDILIQYEEYVDRRQLLKEKRNEKRKQDSLEKTLEDTIEQLEHDEFLYLKSIAKKYEIDIPR